jgi:hypothetical protein
MNNQTKQKRPKYTLEFKKDAARLIIAKGNTHYARAQTPENTDKMKKKLVSFCGHQSMSN